MRGSSSILLLMMTLTACGAEEDLITSAKAAVTKKLNDPSSAQFADIRLVKINGQEFVCGRINARNRMGGYDGFKPFLFTPSKSGYQAIIYEGAPITDDFLSQLAQLKGFKDTCE